MKLKHTLSAKPKSGMTLLELTVVILVLLSLISILFVGARAWKKGSDRSANIMNLRNSQQAMRGHQNMKELVPGSAFTQTDLTDYIKMPVSPVTGGTYTAGTVVTSIGTLWLQRTGTIAGDDGDYGPKAGSYSEW